MPSSAPSEHEKSASSTTVLRHPDFVRQTAAVLAESINQAIARGPYAVVALSGGSTPAPVLAALSEAAIEWSKVVFTFGDERCVPPDHENSNFRMARINLLDHAVGNGAKVIRLEGELSPDEAAHRCERALRILAQERGEPILRHDVLMLGLGNDGHTASLFPDTSALEIQDLWVAPNHVPQIASWRLTFTFPLINAAREIHFLVKDPKKESVIQQVLLGEGNHPASRVRPSEGRVIWHLGHLAPA